MNTNSPSFNLELFPSSPGVYIMRDKRGNVIYVGKAKNLKRRVQQYFVPGRDGRLMVPFLTAKVERIETIVVASEKEALLLENNLIKEHQPKYNALLKDDKTFFSLMINHKHRWPMLKVVRYKGKPPEGNLYFGPYTDGTAARTTLDLLRSLFPLRQCSDRELSGRTRPCILYDLKRCIAPCVNQCTKEEYDEQVEQVIQFLRGHDSAILQRLKKEREKASNNLEYEKAKRLHHTICSIEKTLEKQRVQKGGHKDCDVLALYREATDVILTQLLFRQGRLIASFHHPFRNNAQEDEELLSSFILQIYDSQKDLPQEIIVPIALPPILEVVVGISIRAPCKGNKYALIEMATANATAQFKREKESKADAEQLLLQLEEKLHLTNYPAKIECFDNSHLAGKEAVAAMVVFEKGVNSKKEYRKYSLKETKPGDDYGAIREVLERRYRKEENLPDLIVIDGGKGHLKVAYQVLSALNISTVDVIAVAKEEGRHDKGSTLESIFLVGKKDPVILPTHSPLLFLLQRIRDEAHRFAISFHKQRRKKSLLHSELDALAGIGPVKRQRLLSHFGSIKRLLDATTEEWTSVKGINKKDIAVLSEWREIKLRSKYVD
ncbi:MAG: excinuclease ABC subunit UvrC [Chlamydiales bacterium]